MDHNGNNVNFHLLKHHMEKEHQCPEIKNFVILSTGFWNNTVKKKISETL